jgi:hypothetical protein
VCTVTPSSSILRRRTRAALIDLHGHQARREFHHMRFQLQVAQGLRAFEAQQPAADHHARGDLPPQASMASRSSMVR